MKFWQNYKHHFFIFSLSKRSVWAFVRNQRRIDWGCSKGGRAYTRGDFIHIFVNTSTQQADWRGKWQAIKWIFDQLVGKGMVEVPWDRLLDNVRKKVAFFGQPFYGFQAGCDVWEAWRWLVLIKLLPMPSYSCSSVAARPYN